MSALGFMYYRADGVERDYNEAYQKNTEEAEKLRRAAKKGEDY